MNTNSNPVTLLLRDLYNFVLLKSVLDLIYLTDLNILSFRKYL